MDIPIIKESQEKKEVNKPLSIQIISPGQEKKEVKMPLSIPIISASQIKSVLAPIPIISGKGVTEYKTKVGKGPIGPRPVIPTGDTCCTKVCTIINDKVRYLENELRFREEQLSTIQEGLLLETVKVVKPKKGELERIKKTGSKKVETEEVEQERRVSVAYSQSRLSLKKQIHAITNQLSSLKDARYEMVEKGSCKCIEEVKFLEKVIPLSAITEMKK